jgi:NADPH2 dehydrogenase
MSKFVIEMRMKDPLPTFTHLFSEIKKRWPDLAYIHVIEPRQNEVLAEITGAEIDVDISGTNDPLRKIWAPRPYISCGAYDRALGIKIAEEKGDIIAYGRPFIANVS